MSTRVDISVHVESCSNALATRHSGGFPALGGGALELAWVAVAGLVTVAVSAAVLAARFTAVAFAIALFTAGTACRVIGLLESPLKLGASAAAGLARVGGE